MSVVNVPRSQELQDRHTQSYSNQHEAQCIAKFVKDKLLPLLQAEDPHLTAADIGVISLYKQQVQLIDQILNGSATELQHHRVTVSTVDAFQGAERKIILVSTVRANSRGQVGFADDTRRINVALTRAKHQCVIFAHVPTLQQNELWQRILSKCTTTM